MKTLCYIWRMAHHLVAGPRRPGAPAWRARDSRPERRDIQSDLSSHFWPATRMGRRGRPLHSFDRLLIINIFLNVTKSRQTQQTRAHALGACDVLPFRGSGTLSGAASQRPTVVPKKANADCVRSLCVGIRLFVCHFRLAPDARSASIRGRLDEKAQNEIIVFCVFND